MLSWLIAGVKIEHPSLSKITVIRNGETGDLAWLAAIAFATALVVVVAGILSAVARFASRPVAAPAAVGSATPPTPVRTPVVKVSVAAAPSAPVAPAASTAAPPAPSGPPASVNPETGKKRSAREMMALREAAKSGGAAVPPVPAVIAPDSQPGAAVPQPAAPHPADDIKVPTRDPETGKKLSAREMMALREKMLAEREGGAS